MAVSDILDYVEQRAEEILGRGNYPDRRMLLRWLNLELRELSGKEEFDFLAQRQDPILATATGKRDYILPENFGVNFMRAAGRRGQTFLCKINNGSSESELQYKSASQFFQRDMQNEGNGVPTEYTILSTNAGRRQIWFGPPPDSNSDNHYTLNGVYIPRSWSLDEEGTTPPFPSNNMYLEHALLAKILQGRDINQHAIAVQLKVNDLNDLMLEIARNRESQMIPDFGNDNENTHALFTRYQ